ncbi:hypothetical protein KCP69_25980 [Salmonella enterica subsp. enterica]|nr:hypothetical protein KCP69_25980 [Salmonella enterica subsp. enterica]
MRIRQICHPIRQRGNTRRTTCISAPTWGEFRKKLEHVAGISCAGQLSSDLLTTHRQKRGIVFSGKSVALSTVIAR